MSHGLRLRTPGPNHSEAQRVAIQPKTKMIYLTLESTCPLSFVDILTLRAKPTAIMATGFKSKFPSRGFDLKVFGLNVKRRSF